MKETLVFLWPQCQNKFVFITLNIKNTWKSFRKPREIKQMTKGYWKVHYDKKLRM